MYYENRAESLSKRNPKKSLPKCYVFEELRDTIENHKMGIGFDDLADVNYFGRKSGPSRLGFVLRTFRVRVWRFALYETGRVDYAVCISLYRLLLNTALHVAYTRGRAKL
jgi:hypothetical protein